MAAIFFYLFAFSLLGSAFLVIAVRNPVHSVLFLIVAFASASGLFLLIGAEFLGMLLIVVYVGAVAVLFLFVVMMLDVDFVLLKQSILHYLPIGAITGVIVLFELIVIVGGFVVSPQATTQLASPSGSISNTKAIGEVLYTHYSIYFELAGFILVTAMIGAIVLTLQHKRRVKRQDIATQNARTPSNAVDIVKVKPRQGLSAAE